MSGKEKYFHILGIKPTDDINVIKKAYRKKAFKFHPDRNASPDAHYQFIKITEAYEILIGQRKDPLASGQSNYRPKTREEVMAEKMARARARWKQQQEEEERKDREYYQKVAFGWKWKAFIVGAIYAAIFSTLLSIDYFIDGDEECLDHHEVISDYLSRSIGAKGEQFKIQTSKYWLNAGGYPPIRGNYSYLFHDLKSVSIIISPLPTNNRHSHSNRMRNYINFENKKLYNTYSYSSVYQVFPILHIMFIVPLALVVFKRPNLRFSIWRLVSIWIIYPTIIFFTFSNDRIFNLIDLILGS
ncbi:MAG: J domain-containing protein [Crocinitomicaceae bacterium]|nr:J domain-containing protein [Crocinitomicaceae bacterium]